MEFAPVTPPNGFLPRLGDDAYRGNAVVFWTHTVKGRATGWLTAEFHAAFREMMLHAAVRENLVCPIYTLMPDHVHLIWMGVSENSDQRLATRFLRNQMSEFLLPHVWQHQPHDCVLRKDQRIKEAFALICEYIADNPVRGGLAEQPANWAYTGCVIPGYPIIHPTNLDFWEKFWRLYESAIKHGAIGKMKSGETAV